MKLYQFGCLFMILFGHVMPLWAGIPMTSGESVSLRQSRNTSRLTGEEILSFARQMNPKESRTDYINRFAGNSTLIDRLKTFRLPHLVTIQRGTIRGPLAREVELKDVLLFTFGPGVKRKERKFVQKFFNPKFTRIEYRGDTFFEGEQ
jgi:hypothetical protein